MVLEFSGKVRKTQHQNPEFGHTQGEIFLKNLQNSTLAFIGSITHEEHFCHKLVEIFKKSILVRNSWKF
jgi:hypothetical protein